ncbi:MAG: extracellular solute-binding protein [Firmicutes bacterium]|nr:extracellular solute-binding protein [Bacillota bacterium]
MKYTRKFLGFFAILAAASLAACGGGGASGETGTDAVAALQQLEVETADDGREIRGNMYLEGLPLVRERESFTIFADDAGTPEEKVMFQIWAEETGVDVNLELMPHPGVIERFNIMLNAGDYPDLIGGWLLNDARLMEIALRDRIAIPIGDLIAEYAPNIDSVLNLPSVRETMTLPDGQIYTIPFVAGEPLVVFAPWINTTWLDNLGLDMPTTVDEFTDVLRAFRDNDPRGDGVSVIPMSVDPQNYTITNMVGYWGLNAAAQAPFPYYAYVDGQFVFAPAEPEFREMMTWFAGLWAEGLLDPEMFTQDRSLWGANGRNNLIGVTTAYGPGDFSDAFEETLPSGEVIRRHHFEPLPVLQANANVTPVWRRNSDQVGTNREGFPVGATTFRTQAFITDNATNPPLILRFFDHIFELENSVQTQWGPIGQRIERLADGSLMPVPDELLSQEQQDTYSWGRVFVQSLPRFVPPGFELPPPEGSIRQLDDLGILSNLYLPYLTPNAPRAWIPSENLTEFSQLSTDIASSYMVEFIANATVGNIDITDDAVWEQHLASLNSLGVDRMTQMINDAINN